MIDGFESVIDQSLSVGVGCCILAAGSGHMNSHQQSVEVKCQRMTVHAAIEAESGLHPVADSHGLAKIVGRS